MATNDVGIDSGPPSHKPDRRRNSSPHASLSKRDKKRQVLSDRLASLSEKFSHDRDRAYREQLQKIQVDTNLIMRVDAYAERPFDALEEEYRQLSQSSGDLENRPGPRTLLEMAGPRFQDWIHHLQDLVEERDYYLTNYMTQFEKKTQQHNNTYLYKVETAKREHRALSRTLRDRLMNTIAAKKFRLNKEREALEISDASALLLHPNQFSLTNPASPSLHGKRATRLRREMDEMPGLLDGKKRKRNPGEDDGSPAPQRRALDTTNTTPLWQGDRLAMRKATGPIYSIDKLFTDKELSMTYNAAAVAAHKHILRHRPRLDENGRLVSSPEGSELGNGEDDHDGTDSVPSAVPMERNVSHATRSARGAPNFTDDKLVGLEALSSFDYPQNYQKMLGADPKLPPTFPSTYVRGHTKQSDFNTPTALAHDDVAGDWAVMSVLKQYDQQHGTGSNLDSDNGSRGILEAVAVPARDSQFVAFLQGERPPESGIRHRLNLPDEPPAPSVAQKRALDGGSGTPSKTGRSATPVQSPAKGLAGGGASGIQPSQAGGTSMSRQSSASGAPMSRSSSRKGKAARGG